MVAGAGADPHAGSGVRALSGKHLIHAADLFPAQTPHGQRRYGVRRPLDAEIRHESGSGRSLYRSPGQRRRADYKGRTSQCNRATAAAVRPDRSPKRGQHAAWILGRKDARHRAGTLRKEAHHLSPHGEPLYSARCVRGDSPAVGLALRPYGFRPSGCRPVGRRAEPPFGGRQEGDRPPCSAHHRPYARGTCDGFCQNLRYDRRPHGRGVLARVSERDHLRPYGVCRRSVRGARHDRNERRMAQGMGRAGRAYRGGCGGSARARRGGYAHGARMRPSGKADAPPPAAYRKQPARGNGDRRQGVGRRSRARGHEGFRPRNSRHPCGGDRDAFFARVYPQG